MATPSLRACGWLDPVRHGIDISAALNNGTRRAAFDLAPLRGAPPQSDSLRVCAFADSVVSGQRLLLEYRSRDGWNQGMPPRGAGWVVAHLTGAEDRSHMSLQIGVVEAAPGASVVTSKGAIQLSVHAASASGVTLTAEVMAPVPVDRAGQSSRLGVPTGSTSSRSGSTKRSGTRRGRRHGFPHRTTGKRSAAASRVPLPSRPGVRTGSTSLGSASTRRCFIRRGRMAGIRAR